MYKKKGNDSYISRVFEHTFAETSIANKSYALDATSDATYIGLAAGLNKDAPYYSINIAKNSWIITDDITTIETNNDIKIALNNVSQLDDSRRINLTLEKLKTIENAAFVQCTALASINLPLVETIENSAFDKSTALASVTFGKAITSFGEFVFSHGDTKNITLTLAADQQKMVIGSDNRWSVDDAGGDFFLNGEVGTNEFCGINPYSPYTFKEIKIAPLTILTRRSTTQRSS